MAANDARSLLTAHRSRLFQPRIPSNRTTVGFHQMRGVARDATVGNLAGAQKDQFSVGGTTAGADPLGSGGGS
jgi:hypothetical protein